MWGPGKPGPFFLSRCLMPLDPNSPEYQAILLNSQAAMAGQPSVDPMSLLENKEQELAVVGLDKRAELTGLSPREQLMQEHAQQAMRFTDLQTTAREALTEDFYQNQQALRKRTAGELVRDIPLSLLSGAVNIAGGVPLAIADVMTRDVYSEEISSKIPGAEYMAPGLGLKLLSDATGFREKTLAPATELLGDYNEWALEHSSKVKQADVAIQQEQNQLAAAKTQEEMDAAIAAGSNRAVQGVKKFGADLIHDLSNAFEHPTTFADAMVEQVPSLGLGTVAKGMVAADAIALRAEALLAKASLRSEANNVVKLTAAQALDKAEDQLQKRAFAAVVGVTEAGSTYGDAAGKILSMDIEELRSRFPDIEAQLKDYEPGKVPPEVAEQIKADLASKIGLTSATAMLPVAALASRLGASFNLDLLGKKAGSHVADVLGEIAEEGTQGAAGQLIQNIVRIQEGDDQQRLLEGAGGAAGSGIAVAGGVASALRAPSAAWDTAAYGVGKVLKRGQTQQENLATEAQENQRQETNARVQASADTLREVVQTAPESVITSRATAPIQDEPLLGEQAVRLQGNTPLPIDRIEAMSRAQTLLSDPNTSTEERKVLGLFVAKTARELRQDMAGSTDPTLVEAVRNLTENDTVKEIENIAASFDEASLQEAFNQLPPNVAADKSVPLDPATAQALAQIKEVAILAPDKITAAQADTALAAEPEMPVEDRQRFELAKKLDEIRTEHEQIVGKKGKTSSAVSMEALTASEEMGFDTGHNGPPKFSAAEHARRITKAIANGKPELAKQAMGELRAFVQHMQNRAASFDEAAAEQVAAGNPNQAFEVKVGGTLTPEGKLDTKTKFQFNSHRKGALETMKMVFADTNAIAQVYNSLAETYPELAGTKPSFDSKLEPTFDKKKPAAKVEAKPEPKTEPETKQEAPATPVEEAAPVTPTPEVEAAPEPVEEVAEPSQPRAIQEPEPEEAPEEEVLVSKGRGTVVEGSTVLTYDILKSGVYLKDLKTPEQDRGPKNKGKSNAVIAMERFTRMLDAENLPSDLVVEPLDKGRTKEEEAALKERLIKFYERFGYVLKPGSDFAMARPRASELTETQEVESEVTFKPVTEITPEVEVEDTAEDKNEIQERFPGLVPTLGGSTKGLTAAQKYERANKLVTGFKLLKDSKSLFTRVKDSINTVKEALNTAIQDSNLEPLKNLFSKEHQYLNPNEDQLKALHEVFAEFVPEIVSNLNTELNETVFAVTSKGVPTKNQDIWRHMVNIGQRKDGSDYIIWGGDFGTRMSLHGVEWGVDDNGKPFARYQKEISEAMALAAVKWAIDNVNMPLNPSDEDLWKMYPDGFTDEMKKAHQEGHFYTQPVRDIAKDITNLLGIKARSDLSRSFAGGIPTALALDALYALSKTGAIELLEVDGTQAMTKEENGKTVLVKDRSGNQKFLKMNFIKFNKSDSKNDWAGRDPVGVKNIADRLNSRSLLDYLLFPDSQELPTFEPVTVIPTKVVGTSQDLSKTQQQAILNANQIQNLANTSLSQTVQDVGARQYLELMGHSGDKPLPLNEAHARSVTGKNMGLEYGLLRTFEVIEQIQLKAQELGVAVRDVPVYVSNRIISNARMMMNGFNGQGNKFMREMVTPIRQVLNLRDNGEHRLAYYLTLAQALGVKTEKNKNVVAVQNLFGPALENMSRPSEKMENYHPEYREIFEGFAKLEDMKAGEEKTALAASVMKMIDRLMSGDPSLGKDVRKNIPRTDRAFHALKTHSRYLAALAAGTEDKFETHLAFELDGKTDGPFHALSQFGFWNPDLTKVLKQLRKAGWIVNDEEASTLSDDANHPEFKHDLYQDNSGRTQGKISKALSQWEGFDLKMLKASIHLLEKIKYFETTMTDEGEQVTVLREASKGPLMTIIYAAGDRTVLGVMAGAIIEYANQEMSAALAENREVDPELQNYLTLMMGSRKMERSKDFYDIAPPNFKDKSRYKKGMFTKDNVIGLIDNLSVSAGGMVVSSVKEEMGDVISTFDVMVKTSTFQSFALKKNYDIAYEELRQKRIQQGRLGKFDALSTADEQVLMSDLKDQAPAYGLSFTGGAVEEQGVNILNKDFKGKFHVPGQRDDQKVGSILGSSLKMDINVNQIIEAGVRIVAMLNIAAGDASMVTKLAAENDKQVLYVFDGIEYGPLDLFEMAEKVNKAVYEVMQYNVLNAVNDSVKGMKLDIQSLTNDEVASLAEQLRLKDRDKVTTAQLKVLLQVELDNTLSTLEERALSTEINKEAIQGVHSSTDHMSGGENPHINDKPVQEDLQAYVLNERDRLLEDKIKNVVKPQVVSKDTPVLDRSQLFAIIDKYGIKNPVRKFVFEKIKHLIPQNLTVYRGTHGEMLAKFNELFGAEHPNQTMPSGLYYNNTIFLVDSNEEFLVHELVHSATDAILLEFFNNQGKRLTDLQKEGATALESLARQFLKLDFTGEEDADRGIYVQNTIRDLFSRNDSAGAVGELMAYVGTAAFLQQRLANEEGLPLLKKLKSIARSVLVAIRKLLDLPSNQNMDTFLGQFLVNFTKVVAQDSEQLNNIHMPLAHSLGGTPATGVQATRLEELSKQFNWMRMHFPRTGTDGLEIMKSGWKAMRESWKIRDAFLDAGFTMTQQEQHAFTQLQTLFASTVNLDAGTMVSFQNLYNEVMPQIDYTTFLTDPRSTNQTDIDEAKLRYNALLGVGNFTKDDAGRSNLLANFVSLALVYEPFREKLSTLKPITKKFSKTDTLDDTIRNAATTAIDKVSNLATKENKASNQKDHFDMLVNQLVQNQQAAVARSTDRKPSVFTKGENFVTAQTLGRLADAANKKRNARVAAGKDGGYNGIINGILLMVGALKDNQHAEAFGEAYISTLNESKLWEPIRQVLSDLGGLTDSSYPVGKLLNEAKHAVSRIRQRLRDEVPNEVRALFTHKTLSKADWKLMIKVIGKTDLQALFGPFGPVGFKSLVQDAAYRAQAIADLESQLGANTAVYVQGAKDLAGYMVHHKNRAKGLLWRNAEAMAQMVGTGTQIAPEETERLAPILDKLISLRALEALQEPERAFLGDLLEQDAQGMTGLMQIMKTLNQQEFSKPTYQKQALNRWKGYVPVSLDPRSDLVIATAKQGAELVKKGYRKVRAYQGDSLDPSQLGLAYYAVNWSGGQATFNQGAMQTVEGTVGGVDRLTGRTLEPGVKTLISDPDTVRDITDNKLQGLSQGEHNLLPVFGINHEGVMGVVAYERVLDPSIIETHLTGKQDLAQSIGIWMGRQAEEKVATMVNETLVQVLKKNWNDAAPKMRQKEYVDISSSDNTAAVKEAWSKIPRETQDMLKDTFPKGKVMVRLDMIENAIGYRSASIADVFTGMTDLPKPVQKLIVDAAYGVIGPRAYQVLTVGERSWQSLVGSAKDIIVVRSGIVALANGLANQFQMVQMGINPKTMLKQQLKKFRETEVYLRNEKRLTQLEFKRGATRLPNELSDIDREIQVLNDANSKLSIWPLIQAGLLPSIAEGLTEQDEYSLLSDATSWVEKRIKKWDLNPGVSTAAKYAVIAKDTALYQGLNRMIQFGDFMAKAVTYDHLIQEGSTQKAALKVVDESFVNYNLLPGRTRDYLESMGLTWFLNYKIRIQKIVIRTMRKNPLRFLMAGIGADWAGQDSLITSALPANNLTYSLGPGQFFRAPKMLMWNQLMD